MSDQLTLILFSYDSEKSITEVLPSEKRLNKLISKNTDIKLTIMAFDSQIEVNSKPSDNVIFINKPLYDWAHTNNIDDIEGDVYFIAINTSEEAISMYSIMEELETQKYLNRRYFSHLINEELKLNSYIEQYKEAYPIDAKSPVSPKKMKRDRIYQLYSGKRISKSVSDLDKEAILWRIILLTEYIKFYLQISFQRKYNIEEMRKLPSKDDGYVKNFLRVTQGEKRHKKADEKKMKPFYSKEEISTMVENSYYFQSQDPILKGFILAHPVRVVEETSDFKDVIKMPSVSPLDIGRDVQFLIFNHGQFREELLISMMKVVACFAAENGFLSGEDFSKQVKIKKKETKTKSKTAPTIIKKKGVTVTSGILRVVEPQEEEERLPRESIKSEYYTSELWEKIIERIRSKIESE